MIAESELIINDDGTVFHLHMLPEQLADNVILVGDRKRVDMFRPLFDSVESETSNREFVSVTGMYGGKRITCLSTGIGIGNIDVVMNELDALANIDLKTREVKAEHRTLNILRLGTCGGIQPDVPVGTYVFSEYSVGIDGLVNWYADREKVTDERMAKAFVEHAHLPASVGMPYFAKAGDSLLAKFSPYTMVGMTISAPGFYGPQGRVIRIPLAVPDMMKDFESFRYEGRRILNFEMEGSAIAALARHLGHEAGTVCCVIASRYFKSADTNYLPIVAGLVKLVMDKI